MKLVAPETSEPLLRRGGRRFLGHGVDVGLQQFGVAHKVDPEPLLRRQVGVVLQRLLLLLPGPHGVLQ